MRFPALCLILGLVSGGAFAGESPLLPRPVSVIPKTGSFTVTSATQVMATDKAAAAAADYFIALLEKTGGPALRHGDSRAAIRFVSDPKIGKPESYRISVAPSGVTVAAGTPSGLFYGGISLWQLLAGQQSSLPAQIIDDGPRFAWRGLLIDSARHFQSIGYLKQFVDWMAIHKLNLLHWHLTDDQGWRIEIRHFPRLTSFGPYYSQDEIRDLVAYAALRHVTILPEIDMPGHATAALAAYPEWGVAPVTVTAPSKDAGVHENLINVEEPTFSAIETFLDEVMELFPSPYIHVGGDEAVKQQWQNSAAVQARMKVLGIADEEALQSYFIHRIDEYLASKGRRLIGWDEILQGGLAPRATVMSWRGPDGAVAAAKSGHDTVLSPWPLLYLDNRQAAGPSEPPGRGRIVTVEDVYRFNPMPAELTAEEGKHVLGVQANLWTEYMRTEDVVTRMAFPRAAALAEIAWTPAGRLDYGDFTGRLALQQRLYRRLGLVDDSMYPPMDTGSKRYSQQLRLCSDKLVLSLEDDAPTAGKRAIFLVDLMNPCWIYPKAAWSDGAAITANVGQFPFHFQIGKDRDDIHLPKPRSDAGELVIRQDDCDGPVIAELPLAPAIGNDGVTDLMAPLPKLAGAHDLCMRFTGKSIDPMWAINWIDIATTAERP